MMTALEAFTALVEQQQRDRLARECPVMLAAERSHAKLTCGIKYARVDFGGSGKFMVDMATGEIFGIKAYGQVHKGHRYGTLDTVAAWNWAPYYPIKVAS